VEVNLLSSQVSAHAPYGGVVPELASREHLRALPLLARRAVESVGGAVELVAVTTGPGLIGALLVGVRFAAAYAWGRGLPLVGVDHLEGHLVSPFLSLDDQPARQPPEPVLALVASGVHSAWFVITADGARRQSRTRDDAAGESLDKVAQAMGLPYPGGPVIDRLARRGDPSSVSLPQPRLDRGDLDLSFSGLKSAAIRWIRDRSLTTVDEATASAEVCGFLSSYEFTVVEQLLRPAATLIARYRPALLTASGGVAANTLLRRRLTDLGREAGVEVLLPPLGLTTDNAAMIARAGQLAHDRGRRTDPRRLDASAREVWQPPGMRRRMTLSGEGRERSAEDPV
jgi:N6-L-threonylcarbamoyladenine synthase